MNLNFILSFSRSGSTLLMSHLGTHTDVETDVAELNWFYRLVKTPHIAFNSYLKEYKLSHRVVEGFWLGAISEALTAYYELLLNYTSKTCVAIKHPWLGQYAPTLIKAFPDCGIMHLIRHPYDVIASTYHFTELNQTAKKMFGYRDLDNIIRLYATTMKGLYSSEMEKHGRNNKVCLIKYEDYVDNPYNNLIRLFKFLNVDYSDDIINYVCDKIGKNQAHLQGVAIAESRITPVENKWESVLSENQRKRVRNLLKRFIDLLGYNDK